MNTGLVAGAALLALLAITFSLLNPQTLFSPPHVPGSKDHLHAARLLHVTGAVGPESLVFDAGGGGPYTGVADGRILKWEGEERGWTEFAVTSSNRSDCVRPFAPELEHICGRPLGLRFDKKNGDLYIADAYLGLKVVGSAGGLATEVVTEVEGQPLQFTNDMDISEDEEVIYFTDSTTIFQRRQFMLVLLSGDKTGRLMKYNKSTKEVTVLLRGLAFPNGVALSKDGSFVLVAETTTCRILQLWLRGPKAGHVDTFAVLPGFPDNVRRNSQGHFCPALTTLSPPLSLSVTSAARRPRLTAMVKTEKKQSLGFGSDKKETKWHCVEGCGSCCKLQKGPSFPSPEEIFDDPSDVQLYKSLIGPDGWCIHYEKSTRKCSIYPERPYFCRVEPEVFKSLFGVKEKNFHKEACSFCRDTIKSIYGPNSKELHNFNSSIRNSSS